LWSFMNTSDSSIDSELDNDDSSDLEGTPHGYHSDEDNTNSDTETLSPFLHRVSSYIGLSSRTGNSPSGRRSSSSFGFGNNSLWSRITPPLLGITSNSNTVRSTESSGQGSQDESRSNTPTTFFERLFGTNNNTSPSTKTPTSPDSSEQRCPESPIPQKSLENVKPSSKQSQLSGSPNATTQEITPTLDKESCLSTLHIADEASQGILSSTVVNTSTINNTSNSNSTSIHSVSFGYALSLSDDTVLRIDSPTSLLSVQFQLTTSTIPRRRVHSDYKIKKKNWKKKEIKRLKTALSESTLIPYQKNSLVKENKESNKTKSEGCAIQ